MPGHSGDLFSATKPLPTMVPVPTSSQVGRGAPVASGTAPALKKTTEPPAGKPGSAGTLTEAPSTNFCDPKSRWKPATYWNGSGTRYGRSDWARGVTLTGVGPGRVAGSMPTV